MNFTENDKEAFRRFRPEEKAGILRKYLGSKQKVNMKDVAYEILGDYNDQSSQRVSVVTRGYGFDGNNSRRFYKIYLPLENLGYNYDSDIVRMMDDDFLLFVKKYPNPNTTTPEVMEKFLRDRVDQRLKIINGSKQKSASGSSGSGYSGGSSSGYSGGSGSSSSSGYGGSSSGGSGGGFGGFDFSSIFSSLSSGGSSLVGGIIGFCVVAGILYAIFGSKGCASASSCVSPVSCASPVSCLPSKDINVRIDVGYFTDGTFYDVRIVFDDRFYAPLEDMSNKFENEFSKGKHTVYVEYGKNGSIHTTETLTFNVKNDGDLVDLTVYPYGDELVLNFSGQ